MALRRGPLIRGKVVEEDFPFHELSDKLTDDGIDVYSASTVIDTLADVFFGTVPEIAELRQVLIEAVEAAGIPCEYSISEPPAAPLARKPEGKSVCLLVIQYQPLATI